MTGAQNSEVTAVRIGQSFKKHLRSQAFVERLGDLRVKILAKAEFHDSPARPSGGIAANKTE